MREVAAHRFSPTRTPPSAQRLTASTPGPQSMVLVANAGFSVTNPRTAQSTPPPAEEENNCRTEQHREHLIAKRVAPRGVGPAASRAHRSAAVRRRLILRSRCLRSMDTRKDYYKKATRRKEIFPQFLLCFCASCGY